MPENYAIPENPVYDENIRKIQNGDYVDAENVLNPVLQQIINNQAAHQRNKADLLNGKIPALQLPTLNYVPNSQKGAAGGVATLNNSGKVPIAQIPNLAYVPTTRKVNNKALIADIVLTPEDIGVTAKRTCTFVVGTSTAGWTEADCDYLCDGTDDQVEIQAAMDDLPNEQGAILLLPGTYNCSAALSFTGSAVTISGSGQELTELVFNASSVSTPTDAFFSTGITEIRNISISGHPYDIRMSFTGRTTHAEHIKTKNVSLKIQYGAVIHSCLFGPTNTNEGRGAISCSTSVNPYDQEIIISNNYFTSVGGTYGGVYIAHANSDAVTIANNIFVGNLCQLHLSGSTRGKVVNNVFALVNYALEVSSCKYTLVEGNLMYNCEGTVIRVYYGENNVARGNTIFSESPSSSYKSLEALYTTNVTFAYNYLGGIDYTNTGSTNVNAQHNII